MTRTLWLKIELEEDTQIAPADELRILEEITFHLPAYVMGTPISGQTLYTAEPAADPDLLDACKAVCDWANRLDEVNDEGMYATHFAHFLDNIWPQVDAAIAAADPDWVC